LKFVERSKFDAARHRVLENFDNRENISSAIIVSLNNNDIKLEKSMQCAARRTFSGKVVEAFKRRSSSYQLSGSLAVTRKKGNGINHDDKYYNMRVLLLAESEKWYGWRFVLQEISYSRLISIR
jgi:hypothetical protein